MYNEAEQLDGGWKTFKDFTIANKLFESDFFPSFYLKPADGKFLPSYKPVQYITLRVTILGRNYLVNRHYTLSQALTGDMYRISVKREDEFPLKGLFPVNFHLILIIGYT